MQLHREAVLTVLAPPLIFLSGLLTYVRYHDYGILTPEVLLCFLAFSLAGLLVGGLLLCGLAAKTLISKPAETRTKSGPNS